MAGWITVQCRCGNLYALQPADGCEEAKRLSRCGEGSRDEEVTEVRSFLPWSSPVGMPKLTSMQGKNCYSIAAHLRSLRLYCAEQQSWICQPR